MEGFEGFRAKGGVGGRILVRRSGWEGVRQDPCAEPVTADRNFRVGTTGYTKWWRVLAGAAGELLTQLTPQACTPTVEH